MVRGHFTYKWTGDKDKNATNWATHDPIRRDLIFAPPAFFCFSANAQVAHLVLPDTQSQRFAKPKEPLVADTLFLIFGIIKKGLFVMYYRYICSTLYYLNKTNDGSNY